MIDFDRRLRVRLNSNNWRH